MPRIAKADVNRALQPAASTIVEAGGGDGRTRRAELKARLTTLPTAQKQRVDIFFKFVDNRDFKAGARDTNMSDGILIVEKMKPALRSASSSSAEFLFRSAVPDVLGIVVIPGPETEAQNVLPNCWAPASSHGPR